MAKSKLPSKKDFKVVAVRTADGQETRFARPESWSGFWWLAPEGVLHSAVWGAVDAVLNQQSARRAALEIHERLYGDEVPVVRGVVEDKATLNVVRMGTDTLCAKISKQKPKTAFITDGGNWAQQRRARRLDRYVDGTIQRVGTHAKARDEFRDACVKDLGVEKWFLEDGEIRAERVMPEQILVDSVDGQLGNPRCLYQRMPVHREMLRAQIDKWAEEKTISTEQREKLLEALKSSEAPEDLAGIAGADPHSLGDMVEVREAWHLPSRTVKDKKKPHDGRHVITVEGAVLLDEAWHRSDFPFVFTLFSKRLRGFYGCGVAEQLVKWQRTINKKLRRLNQCLDRMARPMWFVEETSDVNVRHLANGDVADIVKYRGQQPTAPQFPAVPPELFRSIEDDARRALESVGVSMMDVAAKKPAGIDSAVGLREWSDIGSERFVLVGQMWEESFVSRARQVMALSEEAEDRGIKLEALVEGRDGLEKISWSEVRMDEATFVLKALPTSSLPQTPAARAQTIDEWQQKGWVDGLTARRLMDMPDLESANNVAFAGQEDIEYALEDILDGKEYETPEPFQDLTYGLKRFQSAYLRARRQGAPEEVLQNLRDWMSQAQSMLESLAPPAPAGPAPMDAGGAPPPTMAAA